METATLNRKRRRKDNENPTMSGETVAKKPASDASPIVKAFQSFQTELDSRHDKFERIVKYSRDVTIQSKRVIFLLHRGLDETTRAKTLEEATAKFTGIKELFKKIAMELLNEDCYQFIRAYSPGLQEFIEAYAFWFFLKYGKVVSFQEVCEELKFNSKTDGGESVVLEVPIPPAEYILGISDLTGELMRLAINSVGQGNLTIPLEICQVLRKIHDEFIVFGNRQRGFPKKLEVLKNSLKKVENTCYTIHIRGSEVPENMLATFVTDTPVDT